MEVLPYSVNMLRFLILKLVSFEDGITCDRISDRIRKAFVVSADEIRDERWSMREDKLIDDGGALSRSNVILEGSKKLLSDIETHLYPPSP